jgi:hypothetical protein
VNSEELEVSLRAEFENYLKSVLAEMKQEISQLQEKVTAEIERHKTQLDEVLTSAMTTFENEPELDAGFRESVIEHLRLSRDEGAQITAMAIAKAEELEKEKEKELVLAPSVGVREIHQAVSEISHKTTQSEILKTLVNHATDFAPRGAFFIVKNEHLVGWRVFGKEKGSAEEKVREVFLPVSADSVLSEAVKSLATVNSSAGGHADDIEVFQKLEYGTPEKMVAIPLVARGRGVAVLYADYGNEGENVNIEGLETLVRVAGLTVEVLASAKTPSKKPSSKKAEFVEEASSVEPVESPEKVSPVVEAVPSYVSQPVAERSFESAGFAASGRAVEQVEEKTEFVSEEPEVDETHLEEETAPAFETVETEPQAQFENVETESPAEFETEPSSFQTGYEAPQYEIETTATETKVEEEEYPAFDTPSWTSTTETAPGFSAQEFAQNFAKETDPAEYAKDFSYQAETESGTAQTPEYEYETSSPYQEVQAESTPLVEEFVPTKEQTYGSFEYENGKAETVSQPLPTPQGKSRLSERNVDLPIEVTEDERRLHNDARRFARLLVSEIKLYNEQKVKEGRDSNDLYDRLREAIDRSREMYDKRVQAPVAAKFDYFHYELVNTLAEGDDNKLGTSYPGSSV